MAIEVVKIAPKSHGSGRCKKINKIEPQKPMKSASNIWDNCCMFIIDFLAQFFKLCFLKLNLEPLLLVILNALHL